VGRHNALDKLIGALAKSKRMREGFVLMSSRCSFELQKCALAGIGALATFQRQPPWCCQPPGRRD
jgi:FdhD protein